MKHLATLAAAALAVALVPPAFAAERTATLIVELRINGQERWQNDGGTDAATVSYQQRISFSTVVRTDGEIVDFNHKDPGYATQQMARAQQVSMAATQARGLAPMTQAEFQDRVLKAQATCGTDTRCLMDLGAKVSEWSLQMSAGTPVAGPAPQGNGEYLNYFGFENCGARIRIELQGRTEGHYADVQGPVPFSVTSVADYDGSALEREALCTQSNFVVDTRKKLLHGDGWLVGPPRGTITRVDRGQTETSQGAIAFRGEIITWAAEQLRNAPLSGTRKGVVELRNAVGTDIPFAVTRGGGKAEVELSWRFE